MGDAEDIRQELGIGRSRFHLNQGLLHYVQALFGLDEERRQDCFTVKVR
jgi:hypothetical protein